MAHDGERPNGTRVSDPDRGNEHIGGRGGPEGPVREILVRASTGCKRAESFPACRFTQDEYQSIVYRVGGARRPDFKRHRRSD